MGKAKKGPKFAVMKKLVTSKAIKNYKEEGLNANKKDLSKEKLPRNVFVNFSIQNKLDLEKGMMGCLYAKCTPCITDYVMAELEKLGQKYRVALRIAKDPRFDRLPCTHKGTYAEDCIVERVTEFRCFIVATCDRDLKPRIRKVNENRAPRRAARRNNPHPPPVPNPQIPPQEEKVIVTQSEVRGEASAHTEGRNPKVEIPEVMAYLQQVDPDSTRPRTADIHGRGTLAVCGTV